MEMMRYGLVALMAMGAFLALVALRVNAEEVVKDDNEPLVDVPDQVHAILFISNTVKLRLVFL